ncbi:MAG TPA: MFS transporter [Flexilinea sp.]|nr:MFS transporter [Flexilinea sp.]
MEKNTTVNKKSSRFTPVVTVIIIFGIISLLGDMVYEAARGANSQYFNLLNINAAQVGLVFGIGEFLGYMLRLFSGIISDKSGKYWLFIFIGYGMLIVIPLMGFTKNWNILVVLILLERIGKSLRSPAKDTIVSGVAENQVGIGFAFGLQEALDQIGAFLGPLIFTLVFYLAGKDGISVYQLGYKVLVIPFILLMFFVTFAYRKIEREHLVPSLDAKEFQNEKLGSTFWAYTAFTFFCTLGFVNFSTVGFHLKANNLMSDGNITLLYAIAMIIDALTALIVGRAYDSQKKKTGRKTGGLLVLALIPFITFLLPFLTLSYSTTLIIAGMVIFGIVMGTHETIMRSAIADIAPFHKRGTSYGVFNTGYGLALLGGSSLMGWFYNLDKIGLIIGLTCLSEFIAILFYVKMNHLVKASTNK